MKAWIVLAFLSPLAGAQAARAPVPLSTGTQDSLTGGYLAMSGDRCAVIYGRYEAGQIFLRTSDGRGVAWEAAVRIDSAASDAAYQEQPFGAAILGQRVLALSADNRFFSGGFIPHTDLFLNAYDPATGVHAAEVALDKGVPQGMGRVEVAQMRVASAGGLEYVHVLAQVAQHSVSNQLILLTSDDGGATFAAPKPIVPPLGEGVFIGPSHLLVDGVVVHVAWVDNRTGARQVYYQRSDDAGQTFGPLVQISTLPYGSGLELARSGATLAASWLHPNGFDNNDVRVSVSQDGGATFPPEQVVGQYDVTHDVVQSSTCAVTADGTVFVVWVDFSAGPPHHYAARSLDGGVAFQPDEQISAVVDPGEPRLTPSGMGLACSFSGRPGLGQTPEVYSAYLDHPSGSFNPEVSLNAPQFAEASGPDVMHNALYNNFIAIWLYNDQSSPFTNKDLYTGGYRPQTLAVSGWKLGAATPSISFSDFDPSSATQVWFLLSHAQGSLVLPDGRDLGLLADGFFAATFSLAAQGVLAAPLSSAGTGALGPFATSIPPGALFAIGVSVDLAQATAVEITDVVKLTPTFGG